MDNQSYKENIIRRAKNLSKEALKLVDKFSHKQSSRIISAQLFRAVTSIAANIIEAQAASSKKDFVNFLNHSLKSANESLFWLELSQESDPSLNKEINDIIVEARELAKMLGSTVSKLRKKL